jgi:hypothetical protein
MPLNIPNIGPKSEAWLRVVGIESADDLERIGPVMAFVLVREAGFHPSLNLLYALAAGLEDRHWLSLTEIEKASLREQVSPSRNQND